MNVLWIPIFSMRSYDTSEYAICKDGNFQLTLSRIMASDFKHITLVLPTNLSDLEEFKNTYCDLFSRVSLKFLKYGINAVDTRNNFWKLNKVFFDSSLMNRIDLIITDITGYAGTMKKDLPFINNFNVTKLPGLQRPYIDEFFESDLKNIEKALFTTVINPCQQEHIVETSKNLGDKVLSYTKIAHTRMLPIIPIIPIDSISEKARLANPSRTIFWPFRISDKAYQFEKFYELFNSKNLGDLYTLMITDPNDSFEKVVTPSNKYEIIKLKPSKYEYYELLSQKPIVIMLDDIDTVLHPGTIEIIHHGCKLITFKNKLIIHNGMIDSINDIVDILHKKQLTGYNTNIDASAFIYADGEISNIYCEKYINSLKY